MIISLTVTLQLPNFGHMNKSTIKFHCRSKTLSMTSFAKGYNGVYFKIPLFKEA